MVAVITIAREYGSGGTLVARELARRLGWRLLDRELIREIARRARVTPEAIERFDERAGSLISRLLSAYWHGNLDTWTNSSAAAEVLSPAYCSQLSAAIIREAADAGQCVIVGRGGQCILRDRDDAFHVFVYGSTEEKIKRIQHLYSSREEAEAAIRHYEQERAAYIRRYYGCDWADRRIYHMMISSDKGIEAAAAAIVEAAALLSRERA